MTKTIQKRDSNRESRAHAHLLGTENGTDLPSIEPPAVRVSANGAGSNSKGAIQRQEANEQNQVAYPGHADPPASPQSELTTLELTGHYSTGRDEADQDHTVQINQAGQFISGHVQTRSAYAANMGMQSMVFTGQLQRQSDNQCVFDISIGEYGRRGTLSFDGQFLTISPSGGDPIIVKRVDSIPRLSAAAIDDLEGADRQREDTPLSLHQSQLLNEFIRQLKTYLDGYTENSSRASSRRGWISSVASLIRAFCRSIPGAQHDLIRSEFYARASFLTVNSGTQRIALPVRLRDLLGDPENNVRDVARFLGIDPEQQGNNTYYFRTNTHMLETPAGGIGTLEVDRGTLRNPDQAIDAPGNFQSEEGWPKTLSLFSISRGEGPSAQRGIFSREGGSHGSFTEGTWNYVETTYPYEIENLSGPVRGAQAGLEMRLPFVGIGGSGGWLTLVGDGRYPPLTVMAEFPDRQIRVGNQDMGWDAGLSVTAGYAGLEERMRGRERVGGTQGSDFGVASVGGAIYNSFETDQHYLTDESRQQLRRLMAENLAAFQDPQGSIQVHGYSSLFYRSHQRQGSVWGPEEYPGQDYNMNLSRLRAQNTAQAIMDILGYRNIRVTPHGADPAFARDPDAFPSDPETDLQEDRRVDIIVNGNVRISLFAN